MNIFHKTYLTECAVIALLAWGSVPASAQVSVSIGIAPPPLRIYSQPICPGDGYMWTPGYWADDDGAYYWVPGAWVQPPDIGVFWTPPYWGWNGNAYSFYSGYWGQNVGYYGGINYGYGYGGIGYRGGRWQGGHFAYNTAVNNVGSGRVHYSYADRTAISGNSSRVSYNGGRGGVQAQPTATQRQTLASRHTQSTAVQKPALRLPQATSINSSTGASSNRQIKAARQTSLASHSAHVTQSHVTAVKSQRTAAIAPKNHSAGVSQLHPASHVPPQTHAQPQGHPQAQTHAQPQSHARSQGNSAKSRAH